MAIEEDAFATARRLVTRALDGNASIPAQPGTYKVGVSSRSAWIDEEGLEKERMERLNEAQVHLDRSVTVEHEIDQVANSCLSVVLYWSAVERTKLREMSWAAVRNRICHIPDPRIKVNPDSERNSHFDANAFADDRNEPIDRRLLPVRGGAIPKLDPRLPLDEYHSGSLGWVIRETKCFLGISWLGQKGGLFAAWEQIMMRVAADGLCEWEQPQVRAYFDLFDDPDLRFKDLQPPAPDGYADGWFGMEDLISTTSGTLNQWLWDQIGFWGMVHASLFAKRLSNPERERGRACDRHCETARWEHARPICEVFQWDEPKCEAEALSPEALRQRVLDDRRPYLPRKQHDTLIHDLPPDVEPENDDSSNRASS